MLATFARLAPVAEASVQPPTLSLASTLSLGGFTIKASAAEDQMAPPMPEDLREGEDYTIEFDLGDTSKIDMDFLRKYLDELDALPQFSDGVNEDVSTHNTEDPRPEVPDFDADISLDGSVVTVTVDGDDVHTSTNWWQGFIAGMAGAIAGALAGGACAFLLAESGPLIVKRVCGFVGGFMATLVINMIAMAFDGKLRDAKAWGSALGLSLGVGMIAAGLGDLIEGATPEVLAQIKRAIGSMMEQFRQAIGRAVTWAGGYGLVGIQFIWDLIQSLKGKVVGAIENFHAMCQPPPPDYLVPDDYPGPPYEPVPDHGEWVDVDSDGAPDYVDNDADGTVSVGDALVVGIITYHNGEPIYRLIEVVGVD
ncbi:hypothetical protein [Promicromonospora sp. NPDC023987]|uniref:hypothetical protein n=1 Tax=Promicromonospora sp. NPDC023987 TaxID=3155360 RepID=UPI0033D9E48A